MAFAAIRVLCGCLLALWGCTVAIRIGEEPERRTAILMGAVWAGTTGAQVLTGRLYESAIIGHFMFGAGLLWLVAHYRKPWLWFMTAIGSCLFFIHALLYTQNGPFARLHLIVNDLLVYTAPLLLAAVAVHNRNRRRAGAQGAAAAAGWTAAGKA